MNPTNQPIQPNNTMQSNPPQSPQTQPSMIEKKSINSTQNSLQIAEIRDGIVIMNDGTFRGVVMVESINFDLMSPQEQEAIEFSYQGFLNSLYFPIQIHISTQKIDIQPYIEKLDKIRSEHDNMLLAMLMQEYIDFINDISTQTNIMDKKFYIVIPYFPVEISEKLSLEQSKNFIKGISDLLSPKKKKITINEVDLEKAKDELRNRVQTIINGLSQIGLECIPLDTKELIELYYNHYNPDTATIQPLSDFARLNSDVVIKGKGVAPQAHLKRELE